MEKEAEYQLLKLKVASEIVRSGQTAVAFSRTFYLEEILINKIEKELKDLCQEKDTLQKDLNIFMDELEQEREGEGIGASLPRLNESQALARQSIYQKCHSLLESVEGKQCLMDEFRERIMKAEAKKQAKSCLLQKLSSHDLMNRFETMSLEEFREIQVPEFSCFINDSDFECLGRLNEDWCLLKDEIKKEINESSMEIQSIRQELFERSFCASSYDSIIRLVKTQTMDNDRRKSGGLVRRVSTLLRRKDSSISISSDSNRSSHS